MPGTRGEAPSLARLVRDGKLEPVEERLPEQPLVVPVIERIGTYGGTWRRAFTGPADGQSADRLVHDHLIYFDLDGQTIVPHIARAWHVNRDATEFTFELRKGMKWSDGHPFGADDFVFAFEDMLLNEVLNPKTPDYLKSGGKIAHLQKIDDHTIRYVYQEPFHLMPRTFASLFVGGQSAFGGRARSLYSPRHYLEQFHPRYVPEQELDKKARASGFENWVQLFRFKASCRHNPQLPVVGPWKVVSPLTAQLYVLERNPYYWAVDTAGNQLPYIDRIQMQLTANIEVLNLKAIAGEIDMQHRHIHLAKVPLLKANSAKGQYRVLYWPSRKGSQLAIAINQTWKGDAEIQRWLRNRDFRIALSLALDREAINEVVFLGTGKVRAAIPRAGSPYYPGPEYELKYARCDIATANQMLDSLGLDARDAQGFRKRLDGRGRLVVTLAAMANAFVDGPSAAQLIEQQWADVGIKVDLLIEERSLFQVRRSGNEHQMVIGTAGRSELWAYPTMVPCWSVCNYAPEIGRWYETNGAKGLAPTGDFKRLLDLYEQGKQVPFERRVELGKQMWRILADNMYYIGIVGQSPAGNGVVVVKNHFRNVPDVAPNDATVQNPGIARPEQFFFDRQIQ